MHPIALTCLLAVLLTVLSPLHATSVQPLDDAVATAQRWLAKADAGDSEAMSSVEDTADRRAWRKQVNAVHRRFGKPRSRDWLHVARISDPADLPAGEYLNVTYHARYTHAPLLETVSLRRRDNDWVPVGFFVRPVQAQSEVTR